MKLSYLLGHPYKDRKGRAEFINKNFKEIISSTILNIGSGEGLLTKYLSKPDLYKEVDISGNPDYQIDLEKTMPLPFENNSFETVLCNDVLEHLDNFHEVFAELIRISKNNIIISLPNCSNTIFRYFLNSEYTKDENIRMSKGKYLKYYGLPYKRPIDRHKWFFSFTEAYDFFSYNSKNYNYKIEEVIHTNYYSKNFFGKFLRFLISFISNDSRKNIFCGAFWIVLKKTKS